MLGSKGGALWDKTNTELTSYKFPMFAGLSLKGGGRGFSPVAMNVAPGYFRRKIEEK